MKYIALVASASVAHLYSLELKKSSEPRLLKSLVHPLSRKRNSDIASDTPGKVNKDCRGGGTSLGFTSEPKEVEKDKFVKELTGALESEINHDPKIKFILIAEPRFMGRLHKHLPVKLASHVAHRITKDLTHASTKKLAYAIKAEMSPVLVS